MMKTERLYLLIVVLLGWFLQTNAHAGNVGIGVIVGEPTGLSLKKIKSRNTAYDFALAWSTGNHDQLYFHSDYLIHKPDFIRRDFPGIPAYLGIGGRLLLQDSPAAAVRFPIGISDRLREIPLEGFIELVPMLNILPGTSFEIEVAAGIRYYF